MPRLLKNLYLYSTSLGWEGKSSFFSCDISNESIVCSRFNFVARLIVCSIMWPSPIVLVLFGYEQA